MPSANQTRYMLDREWMEAAGRITCEAINALERECIAPADYEAHYTEFIEYAAVEVYSNASDPKFIALSEECHFRVARSLRDKASYLARVALLRDNPVGDAILNAVATKLVNGPGISPEVARQAAESWVTHEQVSQFVHNMFRMVCESEGW